MPIETFRLRQILSANGTCAVPENSLKRSSSTKRALLQFSCSLLANFSYSMDTADAAAQRTTRALLTARRYLSREIVSQTKVKSCGNPTAAPRAIVGLREIRRAA